MLKGYDDSRRVKITHWPRIWRAKRGWRDLRDAQTYGKEAPGFGAIRWPYSVYAENGWSPILGKYKSRPKRKHK